ncbi:MAG: hypothetical protein MHM6MM_003381 [Cercozoa sp. M6MM]
MSSPAVAMKRIMREAREFQRLPEEDRRDIWAQPTDDLFEWHFTIRGAPSSPYEHGIYHGRLLLPSNYPFAAPDMILLTNNGRFRVGDKICLSATSYHNETWQPSWSVLTLLTAVRTFMTTPGRGAIGSLEVPDAERRRLAQLSRSFRCDVCQATCADLLNDTDSDSACAENAENAEESLSARESSNDNTEVNEIARGRSYDSTGETDERNQAIPRHAVRDHRETQLVVQKSSSDYLLISLVLLIMALLAKKLARKFAEDSK